MKTGLDRILCKAVEQRILHRQSQPSLNLTFVFDHRIENVEGRQSAAPSFYKQTIAMECFFQSSSFTILKPSCWKICATSALPQRSTTLPFSNR